VLSTFEFLEGSDDVPLYSFVALEESRKNMNERTKPLIHPHSRNAKYETKESFIIYLAARSKLHRNGSESERVSVKSTEHLQIRFEDIQNPEKRMGLGYGIRQIEVYLLRLRVLKCEESTSIDMKNEKIRTFTTHYISTIYTLKPKFQG
jgi:hypothetical protein